ncbi:hypothetical protein [Caballeronia catudaia]|uniref:hypothetical protein n=1 Tax=Caballeronia catudaia TaxID=1777136 RepID=UPI001358A8E9|nr:hypothetical protein [Caballeronia catudaia]
MTPALGSNALKASGGGIEALERSRPVFLQHGQRGETQQCNAVWPNAVYQSSESSAELVGMLEHARRNDDAAVVPRISFFRHRLRFVDDLPPTVEIATGAFQVRIRRRTSAGCPDACQSSNRVCTGGRVIASTDRAADERQKPLDPFRPLDRLRRRRLRADAFRDAKTTRPALHDLRTIRSDGERGELTASTAGAR